MSLLIHHFPARNWQHAIYFFCLGMWFRQISSIDHLAVKNALQQDSPAQCSRNSSKKKIIMKILRESRPILVFCGFAAIGTVPTKKHHNYSWKKSPTKHLGIFKTLFFGISTTFPSTGELIHGFLKHHQRLTTRRDAGIAPLEAVRWPI